MGLSPTNPHYTNVLYGPPEGLMWQITGTDDSPVAIHQRPCKINMVLIQFKQEVAQTILWTKQLDDSNFYIQTQ